MNKKNWLLGSMLAGCILLIFLQLSLQMNFANNWQLIFWQLRLPRLLFVLGTGLCLGLSTLLLAATLRQPYIDGSMLGIANGAELLVALLTIINANVLTYRVLVGALAGVLCLFLLRGSVFKLKTRPVFMIIGGFCLAMFFNALTVILTSNSGWIGKSMGNVTWIDVIWLLIILVGGSFFWLLYGRYLPYFALPEIQTRQLAFPETQVAMTFQIIAALWLGAATAVLGTAFFAGVVLNQLIKELTKLGIVARLPLVAIFSILMILTADTLGHFAFYPTELPTNAVLLLLLAPAFVFLIVRWSRAL
ncbi:MAG: iron ABC transporter permease [Liquorilactobacillus nagelii]|uniref:iron chelate uptake ABC transporter family permease subunit n=1 Tax=Liquorilactobacillus nagelii TaxID=82688 RepID=UPI00242C0BF4|nr:iron chelate uptake ABC transporter family permease subunit [Liquorilactobacillus nagelii]MCI1633899.1 iron ABC transporter permease [Liquorilactobacillus nagelii]MCI1920882.1 iron ABC transporter permease [Liquorilactobacillus nagelii]MCI1976535.1 iron ABC transporter permease [Liquorilactobacillus nagelii]